MALAEGLQAGAFPALEGLNPSYCQTPWVGIKELLAAFRDGACSGLRQLDIQSNCIGNEGAVRLSEALQAGWGPDLEEINLRRAGLGRKGVHALAQALRKGACPSLKKLDLGFHEIGGKGVVPLARALHATHALTDLILPFTEIGEEGLQAWVRRWKRGPHPS